MRKFLLSALLIFLTAGYAFADLAPLNPEFLRHKNSDVKASSLKNERATGYIPGPINLSHLANEKNLPEISAAADETLPVSYDLRKLGRVTPIRNQETWGTCWAFATVAAIESNYLTRAQKNEVSGTLGDAETLDLSELQLAWFIHNHPQKDFENTAGDYQSREETSLYCLDSGGYVGMGIAFFSALEGGALEKDLPYLSFQAISDDVGYSHDEWQELFDNKILPSYKEFQFLAKARSGKKLLPDEDKYPEDYGVNFRLTDALFGTPAPQIGSKARSDIPDSDTSKYPNFEFVKRLIIEHGAVNIAYHSESGSSAYINTEHHAYRYGGEDEKGTNHEVALVGWDDTFSRENFNENYRPKEDGAWLVRNSWGENEPTFDGGYFWMSYEQPFTNGTALIVEDIPKNLGYYQHDPLGWCNAFSYDGLKSAWLANTFKITTSGEEVESIAFYTTDNNALVEWSIYSLGTTPPKDGPFFEDSIPARRGSLTLPYAGYHTVKLDELLPIEKGNYFSVVLHITNPLHEYPAAVEIRVDGYSDFANVHDGESWFSPDGIIWQDGTENVAYIGEDRTRLHHIPMNACIKAFTQDFDLSDNAASFSEEDTTPITILGIELNRYPITFSAQSLNDHLRDRPARTLTLNLSSDEKIDGEQVTFYLVNRNIENEFTLSYSDGYLDDKKALGGLPSEEKLDFDPIFLPGYEPNEFWRQNGLEFPAYGPFVATAETGGKIPLDVDELLYSDGESGAIPEGYYDFVYNTKDAKGSIKCRLAASEPQPEPEPISRKSSGGCNVGVGFAALGALLLLMKRK